MGHLLPDKSQDCANKTSKQATTSGVTSTSTGVKGSKGAGSEEGSPGKK